MLRKAQTAVLQYVTDPARVSEADAKQFVRGDRFSKNVVCITLAGPDFTNLTFVDLPGEQPMRHSLLSSQTDFHLM